MQRHLQRLERVDAVVGRAHATPDEHELAAAKGHVLLRLFAGDAVAALHRGHVGVVRVDDGEGGALRVDLHRLAEHRLAHAAVIAQRELRHRLVEPARGLHDDDGEPVGGLGVAAAHAADDHAAVVDLVDLLEVLVEAEHDAHRVLLGDAPGVHVVRVELAEVVVHAAVVHQVGADRVDPHQLHALQEGARRAVLDRLERVRHVQQALLCLAVLRLLGERQRLNAVARAGLAQALDPHFQRVVERGHAVFLRHLVDLALQSVKAQAHQLFKVHVGAGHAATAVRRARARVALGQQVAVAVRKRDVQLADGAFLLPVRLQRLQRELLGGGQPRVARLHGLHELVVVEVVGVARPQQRVAAHLRGEAHKVVLVAARDDVVFVDRHQDVLELEIEAACLAQRDVPAVFLVDARELQRIVQFLQIGLERGVPLLRL